MRHMMWSVDTSLQLDSSQTSHTVQKSYINIIYWRLDCEALVAWCHVSNRPSKNLIDKSVVQTQQCCLHPFPVYTQWANTIGMHYFSATLLTLLAFQCHSTSSLWDNMLQIRLSTKNLASCDSSEALASDLGVPVDLLVRDSSPAQDAQLAVLCWMTVSDKQIYRYAQNLEPMLLAQVSFTLSPPSIVIFLFCTVLLVDMQTLLRAACNTWTRSSKVLIKHLISTLSYTRTHLRWSVLH